MQFWTYQEQTNALADGWGVFENSNHGLRIERHGNRFESDSAAQTYVAMGALNGGKLERHALEYLYQELWRDNWA
jgi:hypothetical protein